jgi:hypothetical protein
MGVTHNLIGGRIEPERMDRIWEVRLRATHWVGGIEVGDLIRWNPARDVQSLATFQILSSRVPQGCNGVYKVELARIAVTVHIMGATYVQEQVGHLVRNDDDDPNDFRRYGP